MGLNYLFNIRAKTIKLKQPILAEGNFTRTLFNPERSKNELIGWEAILRKTAYQNTNITTGDSFFNDSDMKSEYFLVVVYDKKMGIPLLSARYYFNKEIIQRCLDGDSDSKNKSEISIPLIDLNQFEDGEIFIADRLSGNTEHPLYKKYRRFIFSRFYSEILNRNYDSHLILMARSEEKERLLTKYLRLGFFIVGSTMHKGKKHWVVITELKKGYSGLKYYLIPYFILSFFRLLHKLKPSYD